jgi:hypothetical protein
MQKSRILSVIREEITRALVFGISFFTILCIGFTGVAYAAEGWVFGEMLNLILTGNKDGVGGRTWRTDTTGTVANCAKLGNETPENFVKVPAWWKFCEGTNKCIRGIDASGNPQCN